MKLSTVMILSAALLQTGSALADDPPHGTLVAVAVEEVFVPNGFDDNDEVMVVLDGYLPSNCYKLAGNEIRFERETSRYYAVQYARRYPGVCIDVQVPFYTEAHIGVVPSGEFKVKTIGAVEEKLAVKEAMNAGPDDYMYAPVDQARVEHDRGAGVYRAVIEGRFTNSCMRLAEAKVVDSGKTLELLPILADIDQSGACQAIETPFQTVVALPSGLSPGRHLLHVRSLNGKAVNAMFTVY